MAQYRVKSVCFVNGILQRPGAVIEAAEGMKGKALEPVEPGREKPARAKVSPPQPAEPAPE